MSSHADASGLSFMALQDQLAEASTREQYVAVLKITLTEIATALCRLAQDEGFPYAVPCDVQGSEPLASPRC